MRQHMLRKLAVGQAVIWPPAPLAVAQVEELRRTTVRLIYPTATGRLRHPIVRVDRLLAAQKRPPAEVGLAIGLFNPFGRAIPPRRQTRLRSRERHDTGHNTGGESCSY